MAGWLGAIGAGMSAYGQVLGEKNDKEWEQQKADLAYKRQIGMENLRSQNQLANAKTQRGWNQEDAIQKRTWDKEDFEYKQGVLDSKKTKGYNPEGFEITQAEFDKLSPSEQSKIKSKSNYELDFKLDQTEKIYNLTKDLDHKDKVKELETFQQKATYKNAGPDGQDMYDMMFTNPTISKIMIEAQRKGTITKEENIQMSKNYMDAREEFNLMDDKAKMPTGETKKAFKARVENLGEDAANLFATSVATNSMSFRKAMGDTKGTGGGDTGGGGGKFNPQEDVPKLQNLVSKASKGDTASEATLSRMLSKLESQVSPTEYQKIVDQLGGDTVIKATGKKKRFMDGSDNTNTQKVETPGSSFRDKLWNELSPPEDSPIRKLLR